MLSVRSVSCPVCLPVTLVHCGQTVGRIKMKLGAQVGPCLLWQNGWMDQDGTWHGGRPQPGVFVWDEDPAPSPVLDPFPLWPNSRIHQDATWCGGRPQPMGLCVRWGPSPSQKGSEAPTKFSAHDDYSYCDFVRTLHSCYWFVQVQVLVLYAFYF